EGFIKVYTANSNQSDWLRADWPGYNSNKSNFNNCGDWHPIGASNKLKFFPVSVHSSTWFYDLLRTSYSSGGGNLTNGQAATEQGLDMKDIMQHTNARCFPGGAPQLVAVERTTALGYTSTQIQ